MKKEKILLIIGMILALGLGFLIRGILPENDVDKAQIRAEIEQEIREQVKQEIDAKVLERLEYTLFAGVLNQDIQGIQDIFVKQLTLTGKVVGRDEEKREIKIKVMNELDLFRGESFIEFLFEQPHYFIKTVAITDDTIFWGGVEDDILNFQDIVLGTRVKVKTVQPFKMGTQEVLIAKHVVIFPTIDEAEIPEEE